MDELISRRAAIDALAKNMPSLTTPDGCGEFDHDIQVTDEAYVDCMQIIHELPSAQPELIKREAYIRGFEQGKTQGRLDTLSAQPEQTNSWCINSWCVDCKEYDTKNKCCPRYNRVIKQTLDDAYRHGETEAEARFHAQQRWIPCSERLPEFKYETYDAYDDYTFWDTDFVIGATSRGTLSIGQFTRDSDKPNEFHWDACECDAFDLQGCLRIGDHIIAWMPLPESYTEDKG